MRLAALLALAALLPACSGASVVDRKLAVPEAGALDRLHRPDSGSYLKAHLRDGRVYVLARWRSDPAVARIAGYGKLLGLNREVLAEGEHSVPLDSVVLFETNRPRTAPQVAALAVVTGVSAILTAVCLTTDKACFGSCPTFYVVDGQGEAVQAEGFSASVAPSLEATDVDALFRAAPRGRTVELRMTNEALETHVVRSADLLAARRPPGGRVLRAVDGRFREALRFAAPLDCTAPEGACGSAVAAFDGVERSSLADSLDLAAREEIDLTLPALNGEVGVAIAARQTLLTTYLFYQALAYMGRSASDWLAALGRGGDEHLERAKGIHRALGRIEVLVPDGAGGWKTAGEVGETGPIATDVFLVPLPAVEGAAPRRVRLRLTRGLWRLDYVAAARLGAEVEPRRVTPAEVRRDGVPDPAALSALTDPARVLTTLPGDEYALVYHLPDDAANHDLFLEARGYYLEWMRDEWLAEENAARAALMLLQPHNALRVLAPEFKAREPGLERAFWGSRYVRP